MFVVPAAGAIGAELISDPRLSWSRAAIAAQVPPAGLGPGPDPFAPGPDSPYSVRLEMTDPESRKTFPPRVVEVASHLRYEPRNPAIGLDLAICTPSPLPGG